MADFDRLQVLVFAEVLRDDGVELAGVGFRLGNGGGERYCRAHWAGVAAEKLRVLLVDALVESFPCADDFRKLIDGIYLAVSVAVGEGKLAHILFVNCKDEHLVVSEEVVLDGCGEREVMKLGTVFRLVVHRAKFNELVIRLFLGILAVDARRRRHVEALFAFDEILVVDADKLGFIAILEDCAGRAMRLVADDKVECPKSSRRLRFVNSRN